MICLDCNAKIKEGEERCRCGWLVPKALPAAAPVAQRTMVGRPGMCLNPHCTEVRAAYQASENYRRRNAP
jgi:hypothetical protein